MLEELSNLELSLHNWRCFEVFRADIKLESFILVDDNGSGKTSLLAAFYSLFTGLSWPGTKFSQHLKQEALYLGISSQFQNWFLTGKISSSGRMLTKYSKLDDYIYPKILTYQPTDNYWLNSGRTEKLKNLDNLLVQILQNDFWQNLNNLDKNIKSKSKLIQHTQETGQKVDTILLYNLNQAIFDLSLEVWKQRQTFLNFLNDNLEEFSSFINSPLRGLQAVWDITNLQGNRLTQNLNLDIEEQMKTNLLNSDFSWDKLWQKELIVGQVLFGAHRDNLAIFSHNIDVASNLSRGELRLLVLFIKYLGIQFAKSLKSENSFWWLLDDVFNELDASREQLIFDKILNSVELFIITSTKNNQNKLPNFSLEEIGKNL